MRSHATIFRGRICIALGAAVLGVLALPDLAVAQSFSTSGGMRAPSVNMGSVGPRAPEFRTPRVYPTQSSVSDTGPKPRPGSRPKPETRPKPEARPRPKPWPRPVTTPEPEPQLWLADDRKRSAQSRPPRRASGVPPAGERRFVPNEVVIEVDTRTSGQTVDALARRYRLTRVESQSFELTGTTMFRWTIPQGRSMNDVIRGLEADRNVRSVQPNYVYQLQQGATAASYGDPAQYALGKLRLPEAHNVTKGDRILVAVIDSGIDASHPELADAIVDSLDTLGGSEPHAHGTGIAGAIAAQSRLMGVAPRAKVLAVRAFDPSGSGAQGTTFNILKGLDWSVTKGARVINMSFAGPKDPALGRALTAAHKKGVTLIAAAPQSAAQ